MTEGNHLEQNLANWFGHASFRSGQKESIQSILAGKHTLSVLPTGTGKSLIYQFCGYSLDGMVIIVSPLLSLMDNQVLQMNQTGEKRVAALNSMLSLRERNMVENRLGTYKFLFVSPEMLQSPRLMEKLARIKIALFVVDEAHCISQWGMDFRPEYLFLGDVRNKLNNPLTLALTATAPEKIRSEILETLNLNPDDTVIHLSSPNRENIFYQFLEVSGQEKDEQLLELVRKYPPAGVIYFSSKARAEQVCQMLKQATDLRLETYHADRTTEDRQIIQRQFLKGELDVICATTAFGMGINKADIRYVIHYHMPNSIEEYLQEIGRAGRDGKRSIATLLYSKDDAQFKYRIMQETRLSEFLLQQKQAQTDFTHSDFSDSDLAMMRIIEFKKLAPQPAIAFVRKRIQNRINQFAAMGKLIKTDTCKRTFISHYFNQDETPELEWCCSVCQQETNELLEQMIASQKDKNERYTGEADWKEIIKGLFLL